MGKNIMKIHYSATESNEIQRRNVVAMKRWWRYCLGQLAWKLVELIVALVISFVFTLPLFVVLLFRKRVTGKSIFKKQLMFGVGGSAQPLHYFDISWNPARCLALYPYILVGQLRLIGGSLQLYEKNIPCAECGYIRKTKPGIFSLWQLRKNSRIAHEGLLPTEWEYCYTRSSARDLFLLLRMLPTYLFGAKKASRSEQIGLFDIFFSNTTMKKAVEKIEVCLQQQQATQSIYFVNPDCLNKTFADEEYFSILKRGDFILPDGIGLVIACKLLGEPLRENVNGTDMLPYLCQMAASNNKSIFLLGGRPGVAEAMQDILIKNFGVRISGSHHGYFDHEQDSLNVVEQINRSGADIVLVAFGAPLQEKWIEANNKHLVAGVAIGVGGLFDFYSGQTQRAPRWLREIGLEWCYRILQEPGRMWRRYVVGNPLFLARVLLWKVNRSLGKSRER